MLERTAKAIYAAIRAKYSYSDVLLLAFKLTGCENFDSLVTQRL